MLRQAQVGHDFTDIPEVHIAFLIVYDPLWENRKTYPIGINLGGVDVTADFPIKAEYVNLTYSGTDRFGDLCHDFHCTDPQKMRVPELAEAIGCIKNPGKGEQYMSKAYEELLEYFRQRVDPEVREQALTEGHKKGLAEGLAKGRMEMQQTLAKELLEKGFELDSIASLTHLSANELRQILY